MTYSSCDFLNEANCPLISSVKGHDKFFWMLMEQAWVDWPGFLCDAIRDV